MSAGTLHIIKEEYMRVAIQEALCAIESGDHPIGAVIVRGDTIIAQTGNRVHVDQDPTQHAEMAAIRQAAQMLHSRSLQGCVLYVTHEPCPMCASATILARMHGIVCGTLMEDARLYGQETATWRWRTINVPASVVLEKGDHELFFVQKLLWNECRALFDRIV